MLADLREALRQLRKAPGVTTTAVVTLTLGIGATTAIFTLVHQVMLKSLPVTKPEELWRIGDKVRCCNWGGYTQGDDGDFSLFSWEAYKNFRAQTPEFVDLAALQAGNAPLGVRRAGSRAPADTRNGEYVSGNFFRTFGVQPWIGRLMTDADDVEGAPPVAVMSYRIWNEKYGADSSVVGATYQINGHPFTVIGVAAPGFYGAKLAGWVQREFSGPAFRIYVSDDVVGVELGGALKNVIAIAAGIVEGLGFGHNTAAALITRGLAEITRLAVACGARRETLAGLSGMGDLVLTCTGGLSRNRSVGVALGKGQKLSEIIRGMHGMVAEGVLTTDAALGLARSRGIELPIAEQMHHILHAGKSPAEAMHELMSRPGRAETD